MKIYFLMLILSVSYISDILADTLTLEAEDGVLTGLQISTSTFGYMGLGYITGMDAIGDAVEVTANVVASGSYKLLLRYNSSQYKEQKLEVNGNSIGKVTFPATGGFETVSLGGVFLNSGENSIKIIKDWGWVDIDQIILISVAPHDYTITSELIDSNANNKAIDLYNKLKYNYGKKVLSGQNQWFDSLVAISGKQPVIRSYDFQNYSPHNPWGKGSSVFQGWDDGTTDSILNWVETTNGKGVVSIQWHWLSPMGGALGTSTFMANLTDFDVSQAVIPGTDEYNATIRDIDTIATQIGRLDSAGISFLWRPLHEAGGAWFWWGANGSESCIKLWNMLFERLTVYHNLHNMIWVWSTPEADWYPGNDKVDIFGFDSYPDDYNYGTQKCMFDQMYDICQGEKIIAMTENGAIPNIDNLFKEDSKWAYFVSWVDLVASQNSNSHIQNVYSHNDVLTLDEFDFTNVSENISIKVDLKQKMRYKNGKLSYYLNQSGTVNIQIFSINGRILLDIPNHISKRGNNSIFLNLNSFSGSGIRIIKLIQNGKTIVVQKSIDIN